MAKGKTVSGRSGKGSEKPINPAYGKESYRNLHNLSPANVARAKGTGAAFTVRHSAKSEYPEYDLTTPRTVNVRMLAHGGRFRVGAASGRENEVLGMRYVVSAGEGGHQVLAREEFSFSALETEVASGKDGNVLKVTPLVNTDGNPVPWAASIPPVGVLPLTLPADAGKLLQFLMDTGCANISEAYGIPVSEGGPDKTFVIDDPLYTNNKVDLKGAYTSACTYYSDTVLAGDDKMKLAMAEYLRKLDGLPAVSGNVPESQQVNDAERMLSALRNDDPARFYNVFIRPSMLDFCGRATLYLAMRSGIVSVTGGVYQYKAPGSGETEVLALSSEEAKAIASIEAKPHIKQAVYEHTLAAHVVARLGSSDIKSKADAWRAQVAQKEANTAVPTKVEFGSPRLIGTAAMEATSRIATAAVERTFGGTAKAEAPAATDSTERLAAAMEKQNELLMQVLASGAEGGGAKKEPKRKGPLDTPA